MPVLSEQVCESTEHEYAVSSVAPAERTVLGRIGCVMEAFNDGQRVLRLSDLSERTQLPKSTLHRLAEQLCQLGWIERDSGGYRVGMRLYELGSLAVEGNRLQEAAFPHLQALATKTGIAVQLGILDSTDVVYLERLVPQSLRLPTRRGGRKPAHCTALGKAMLAFDDEAREVVMGADLPKLTQRTITDPRALEQELMQVRRTGLAVDRGEVLDGLVCVAAPIRKGGRPIGAVSVTGKAGHMRWDLTSAAVRSTADAIWNATFRLRATAMSA